MTDHSNSSSGLWLRKLRLFREDNILSDSGILSVDIVIHRLHEDSVEARKGWDYDGSNPDYLELMKTPPREKPQETKGFWAGLGEVLKETSKSMSAPKTKIPWDEIEDIVRANRSRG